MSLKRLTALLIAGALFTWLPSGCGGGDNGTPRVDEGQPEDSPHPWGVYPGVSVEVVDRTFRVRDGGSDDPKDIDPIFFHLASARQSLDIAFPRIDRQEVVDAILSAANSVHVRIITEKAFAEDARYRPFTLQLLSHPNIDLRTDDDGTPRIMHSRFLIIDGARVVVGSYNWSEEGSERTIGDLLTINDSAVASAFTTEFNQMFVERKFGAAKRDATQHSFQVAGGLGMIDVYFGPTNRLDQILQGEVEQSNHVAAVIEQFSDAGLATFLLQWLSGTVGRGDPAERVMFLMINDVGAYGDQDENAVYDAFVSLLQQADGGQRGIPAVLVINQPPSGGWVNVGAHVTERLLFADHALGTGIPAVAVGTGNWTEPGFSLNDEVLVILRGDILATKYHYLLTMQAPHYGEDFITNDVREMEQVILMYPFLTNGTGTEVPKDPALADLSTGLIHGKVDNFRREFTYQDADGNLITQLLDINWLIEGEYYFGGQVGPYVNSVFDENETTNPGHNYILVIPAGTMEVQAVVVDGNGEPIDGFQPSLKTIEISPGGVKQVNFSISSPTIGTGGGGGGGGP